MSVKYAPVHWNRTKIVYDIVLLAAVVAYVTIFMHVAPRSTTQSAPIDDAIVRARAFGTCAFLMMSLILSIGPLARLSPRFLPLLYNRRHFGVLTMLVATTHAAYVFDWYFNFSPTPRLQALLGSNTSYGQLLGFPFEALGIGALLCLAILAATSHDFWLAFLGPRTWKALHYLLYLAYALVVGHVVLGALQSEDSPTFAIVVGASILAVCGLHVAGAVMDARARKVAATADEGWLEVGEFSDMRDGEARIVATAGGERIAVFRDGQSLAALSNACAHQNGPLGEGRVTGGCVTCPWHGFQYRLSDGCSPEPFTERVPTYRLRLDGVKLLVDPVPNPPGTFVEALIFGEWTR